MLSQGKAVVFDVGRVLYHWQLRALFEKLIDDSQELDWFLANVVTEEWHFEHARGRPLSAMVPERIALNPDYGRGFAQPRRSLICLTISSSRALKRSPSTIRGFTRLLRAAAAVAARICSLPMTTRRMLRRRGHAAGTRMFSPMRALLRVS